jgi:hypothetical protein
MNREELRKQKNTLIRDMSLDSERITFPSAKSTTSKCDGDDESAIAVGWGSIFKILPGLHHTLSQAKGRPHHD